MTNCFNSMLRKLFLFELVLLLIVQVSLAQTSLETIATNAIAQKNWKLAEESFVKLLQENPSDLNYQSNYLIALTELKRWDKALQVANQIIHNHPSIEESIRLHKIEIYLEQQKKDSCLIELERILTISPNSLPALLKKAWLEFELEQYDLAIRTYSTILAKNEFIAEAWYGRGAAFYMRNGDTKLACEDWAHAVELGYEPVQEFVKQLCQ